MLTMLVAVVLLLLSVLGVYLLLKSMGQDGVEAAAPGSCKSGRCGVHPIKTADVNSSLVHEQYVQIDEVIRPDTLSGRRVL